MKKYKSELLMVNHQTAEALYKIGAIDDAKMREFDEDCLLPDIENDKKTYIMYKKTPMLVEA
jgi:putative transcriptional regulator